MTTRKDLLEVIDPKGQRTAKKKFFEILMTLGVLAILPLGLLWQSIQYRLGLGLALDPAQQVTVIVAVIGGLLAGVGAVGRV
jgi:hypothetical protein